MSNEMGKTYTEILISKLHHELPTILRIDAEHAGEELERLYKENKELISALKDMCQEFKALDLPYGSEAYTKANSLINR